MRSTDGIDGLLAELGRQVGIDLTFDASRRCVLACDEDVDIEIANPSGENVVLITAPLVAVGSDEQTLFKVCMTMNLGLVSTRGCTLALDERRSAVVLQWLGQADELDHAGLVNRVGGMIGLVGPLQKQIGAAVIDSVPVSGRATVDDEAMAHLLHIRA